MIKRLMILAALFTGLAVFAPAMNVTHASASVVPKRLIAYRWAVAHEGDPYVFGADGPNAFDCSGLVFAAYRHAGYPGIPRTTYGMIAWGVTHVRVETKAQARRGDLAFYGSGHVELVVGPNYTYGAHHTGTVLSLTRITVWYHPTLYLRVIGAGP